MKALRAAGHDVTAISQTAPGASDETVLDLAGRENRILLTEDKDFGQLVYAATKSSTGVIFICFPAPARWALAQIVLDLVAGQGEKLAGYFATVQPGRIRMSRKPGG